MISTRVWMTFTGPYESLGFRPGDHYRLAITWDKNWIWVSNTGPGKTERCPYNSMEAFLQNWSPVELG